MKTTVINNKPDSCKVILNNKISFCKYNKNELLTGIVLDNDDFGFIIYELGADSGAILNEPIMLIPIDNNRAYTFSHKSVNLTGTYKLTRFLKPGLYQDTFYEKTVSYNMVAQTRYMFVSALKNMRAIAKRAIIWIDFDDTDGLTVTMNADGTRMTASCTYSENRQSGMTSTGADTYRDFISIFALAVSRLWGHHFDIKISKVVPSDGAVELFSQKLEIEDIEETKEFSDVTTAVSGSASTFVVTADSDPEVDAYQ